MRLSLNKLVVVLVLLVLGASAFAADDPRANARSLSELVDGVTIAVDAASVSSSAMPEVRARWDAFNDSWLKLEDPLRALSPEHYRLIEERMFDVTGALPRNGDWRLGEAKKALGDIKGACDELAAMKPLPLVVPQGLSVSEFVALMQAALRDARAGATEAAFASVNDAWFRVESRVSAIDRDAYVACEGIIVDLRVARMKGDTPAFVSALERLEARTAPLTRRSGHVGAIDAALILLREGAEALIVLAAIAAFLAKIGAADKARLVWIGGALGLVASVAAGGLLAWAFAGVNTGEKREIVEGVSSLVAAGLLVLVGQWLHDKIRRGGWKKDVQAAVEGGRTAQLLLVAFFAVFREGAETVVFLAGIAPASTPRELGLGAMIGVSSLFVLGFALVRLGHRLPVGPFLSFATLLLWALAVKFAGGGVIALQTGGLVSATRFAPLPEVSLLGFAPTLESAGAQLLLVLAWIGFTLAPRWRKSRWQPKPELSSIEA